MGFFRIAYRLLRNDRKCVVFHITPLCKQFLPFELALVLVARIRRMPVIVDLRAGNQIQLYEERSSVYRVMFRKLLRTADAVTYEGEKYAKFVAGIAPRVARQLLPNFVPSTLPRLKSATPKDRPPVMVYVGQLSESKGVPRALEIFREIRRHEPDARFYLVGAGTCEVGRLAGMNGKTGHGVILAGSLPFEEIVPLLDAADFFLFLTNFPGEGHSNALTEAMARGCVPICTRHGFNPEVIGRAGIVVESDMTADAVAARILHCWGTEEWQEMSKEAVHRVRGHFTQAAVAPTLDKIYRLLTDNSVTASGLKQETSHR